MIPAELFERTLLDFFAPVRGYLEDPEVTEVMINGPSTIYIERRGRIMRTPARFACERDLLAALRNLAQYVGRHIGADRPILEARLPDGSRVEAILAPAAQDGPIVSIRRFSREPLTIERLIAGGAMTEELAEVLAALVACKQNIIVAGGTSSGKTSLLGALSALIPAGDRIVVIEDASELRLQQPHVVRLEAQPPDARGRGAVAVRDLFRATLRMRPDRIVVGEVRGGEALDLVQAMTSGHGGCMATVHATHSLDVVNRLETMALMSDVELPLTALRSQVASAVDFILHTARLADGSRCVTQLTEVLGYDGAAGYRFADLFVRRYGRRGHGGETRSQLVATGAQPGCAELIRAMGIALPDSMRAPAEVGR
ncbi:MAG TPA: ATPase, T2SS/T4P/T4SS family [Kofleriaceae bacterium]|nr:ATPase, T2SS/T4P/T4SS family [Kofleriaceae bacterium]